MSKKVQDSRGEGSDQPGVISIRGPGRLSTCPLLVPLAEDLREAVKPRPLLSRPPGTASEISLNVKVLAEALAPRGMA